MNLVSGGDVQNVPAFDMTRRRELASLIDLQILLLNFFHELLLYLLSNGIIHSYNSIEENVSEKLISFN